MYKDSLFFVRARKYNSKDPHSKKEAVSKQNETAPVRNFESETKLIWLRNPLRHGCTRSVPEWSFSVRRYGFLFQVWL